MRTDKQKNKRAYIIGGGMVVVAIALVAIALFAFFVLNPKADDNQTEIKGVGSAVHKVICAQAQLQANSYRVRARAPDGGLEPVPHFITRMLAQRQLLSLAKGLGCEDTPGFPPFEKQVERALDEIGDILNQYRPEQRKASADHNPLLKEGPIPSVLFPSFTPTQELPADQGSDTAPEQPSPSPTQPKQPKHKAPVAPEETTPVAPVPTNPEAIPAEDDQGENTGADISPAPKTESLPGIVKEVVPPAACSLVDRAAKLCH